jgi:hypothetical protein
VWHAGSACKEWQKHGRSQRCEVGSERAQCLVLVLLTRQRHLTSVKFISFVSRRGNKGKKTQSQTVVTAQQIDQIS